MSLPGVVLLIALYTLTGPNIPAAMAVFGVIVAPVFYRMVRSVTLGTRNELYVDAARVVGLSDLRIVGRHVLWAVRAPVIIQSAFILAAGIGIEAGITFLGLGDPAGTSWGLVMQLSFNSIYNNPGAIVGPALVITITILSLILLGNALSDALQSSARSKPLPPRRRRTVLAAERERIAGTATAAAVDEDVILAVRGSAHRLPVAGRHGARGRARRRPRPASRRGPRPGRGVRLGQVPDRLLHPRHPARRGADHRRERAAGRS